MPNLETNGYSIFFMNKGDVYNPFWYKIFVIRFPEHVIVNLRSKEALYNLPRVFAQCVILNF